MVYEPQEDSELLAKHVIELAKGKVLDMGTGSGFQARAAALSPQVKSVLAVDVDPKAVSFARKEHSDPKITFRVSDLFAKVTGRFNTIIFNPPYLPSEQGLKDRALVGGKRGYEIICAFLKQAGDFLEIDGQILMVYSSLSRPAKIKDCVASLLFNNEELEVHHQFFEDLFVVRFTKSPVRLSLEKDGFKHVIYFARGKRGWIFTARFRGKKVAVKIKNPSSMAVSSIKHEAEMLKRLNKHGIGPRLVKESDQYVAYEFVEGDFIMDFLNRASSKRIKKVLLSVLDQCRIMDKTRISKEEMTRPLKHILIARADKPVLIDFERAHVTHRMHNVTQFCQFLSSPQVRFVLASKKMHIDANSLVDKAKIYANDPCAGSYYNIKMLLE